MIVEKIATWLLYPLCLLRCFVCNSVRPATCKCIHCILYPFEVCLECMSETLDTLEDSCCHCCVIPLLIIREFWRRVILPTIKASCDCLCLPYILTRRFCKTTICPLVKTWCRCMCCPCELFLRCLICPCRTLRRIYRGRLTRVNEPMAARDSRDPSNQGTWVNDWFEDLCLWLCSPFCYIRRWCCMTCDTLSKKFFYWFLVPTGLPKMPEEPSELSRKIFSS
ncbi:hypothetical protein [Turkeypox virus]|uniref:Uncharacterized protein n=1 Tax=Turkeypox virus TaxID=336486 RepID=A0A0M5HZ98_9POXV|nr:hypothetical protein ASN15_gp001 [Turkeypox virus]YP_009177192.1 hypothetical protein ASN15_gp171 [Turkeypox virus]ALA62375.1 hypothetical protein [Turkeypox virus]ALA62545.1 hypothetical protein [Turkeypox virus]